MTDPKLELVVEAAEAFCKALNAYGKPLDVDVRMRQWRVLSETVDRASFEVRISRQHIDQLFP